MSFNIYDIKNYNIDESYKQSFINIKKNCDYIDSFKNIIETYNEEILKNMCIFFSNFKFATKNQIVSLIKLKHTRDEDFSLKELTQYDYFKEFILINGYVDGYYERNEENTIYTIGPNGINLLREYFNIDVDMWEFKNVSRSGKKVIKYLQVVDIYLNVLESFTEYNIIPESIAPKQRRALGDKINIDLEWTIDDNIKQNFILLIIKDEDLKEGFNKKIFKLEHFVSEKGKWRYDYIDVNKKPKVILVCESEDSVKRIARKLRGSSLNKDTLIMYTHDKLLKENLLISSKTLKRYIKESDIFIEYEILNEKEFR